MKDSNAQYLIDKTRSDYNRIAPQFTNKRGAPWPFLERLLQDVKGKVLDVGCGTGRVLDMLNEVEYVGIDSSPEMIEKAGEGQFLVGDGLDIPFLDGEFDVVLSIAVLHHVPSRKLRRRFVREMKRVLQPQGKLIVTVWNLNRKEFLKDRIESILKKITGRSKIGWFDMLYPWRDDKGDLVAQRYHHCFRRREFRRLFKREGFRVLEGGFTPERRNIYIVAEALH